jgi:2,3-bisphosphoglycerate-independent phosphoglycerate mutase
LRNGQPVSGAGLPAAPPPDPGLSAAGRVFRPVVLIVLDGWGYAQPGPGNAVELAATPTFDGLLAHWPSNTLEASGTAVGLPTGQMGNSEVGHLNIGAGRVVYQELTRITHAVDTGEFFANPVLKQAFGTARETRSTFHLMGLVSDGGVHSDLDHLKACLEMARREGVADVVLHAFLDGRDTAPQSAEDYLADVEEAMASLDVGRIGTVCGRYYAMDRDLRWERTKLAYDAMVYGEGEHAPDAQGALALAYARGSTMATPASSSTSGPTARASSHAHSQRRRSTASTGVPTRHV